MAYSACQWRALRVHAACHKEQARSSIKCGPAVQAIAADADGYSAADLEALLDRAVHAAAARSLADRTAIMPGALDSFSSLNPSDLSLCVRQT